MPFALGLWPIVYFLALQNRSNYRIERMRKYTNSEEGKYLIQSPNYFRLNDNLKILRGSPKMPRNGTTETKNVNKNENCQSRS